MTAMSGDCSMSKLTLMPTPTRAYSTDWSRTSDSMRMPESLRPLMRTSFGHLIARREASAIFDGQRDGQRRDDAQGAEPVDAMGA